MTFNYIRNQIQLYKKEELLDYCYTLLDKNQDEISAIWLVFAIIKWSFLYGGTRYPSKPLTTEGFNKIYKAVYKLDEAPTLKLMKEQKIDKAFHVLYSQQFYLQKTVYKEIFATQLKLYTSIKANYDINKSFENKTGLTIEDLIFFFQTIWLIINSHLVSDSSIKYYGYLSQQHVDALIHYKGEQKTKNFINLLLLREDRAIEQINTAPYKIKTEELQSLERTFFTIYPFLLYKKSQVKLLHKSIFNYTLNYYIYDFMKSVDRDYFPDEFGLRFEKYINLGVKEMNYKYKNEKELKKILPEKSKVVDFLIEDQNILVECKAIELTAIASVNPTDELIYSSLKDTVIKAYTKQMLTVVSNMDNQKEYFGIIVTYKELFWNNFSQIFSVSEKDIPMGLNQNILPPENVFLIDIITWDRLVQIVKNKQASLREILLKIKKENSQPQTMKQSVIMSLDEYETATLNLSYLESEIASLNCYN